MVGNKRKANAEFHENMPLAKRVFVEQTTDTEPTKVIQINSLKTFTIFSE